MPGTFLALAAALLSHQQDSLSVDSALALARERSPRLQAAASVVDQAEAARRSARANRLPRARARAFYLRYWDPPVTPLGSGAEFAPLANDNYLLHLGLTQPIYAGGRISSAIRAADWSVRAAQAVEEQTDVDLTAAVAHAFDDALLARAVRDAFARAAATLREAVRVAEEHYAAGTVSRLDALRAQTRLDRAEAEVRKQETVLFAAHERLAQLIGLHPDSMPPLGGSLAYRKTSVDLSALLAQGQQSGEVRALQANAEALHAAARGERGRRWPTLSAFLGGLGTRPELVTGERRFNVDLIAGLSVEWTLYDGGAAVAQSDEREATAAALGARAQTARDERVAALRVSAHLMDAAARDVLAGLETVARSERALSISQERYREGIGIQLDILEATADLTNARTDLLRAIHAHRAALIELRRNAGLPADALLPGQRGGDTS